MTSRLPSNRRGLQSLAYMAATVLGGIGALAVLVVALVSGDAGTREVLTWTALTVLLFGAAAYHWWYGRHVEERSRRIASDLGSADVDEVVEASSGEVDAVRRLRRAHPRLSLRDANDLVRGDLRPRR